MPCHHPHQARHPKNMGLPRLQRVQHWTRTQTSPLLPRLQWRHQSTPVIRHHLVPTRVPNYTHSQQRRPHHPRPQLPLLCNQGRPRRHPPRTTHRHLKAPLHLLQLDTQSNHDTSSQVSSPARHHHTCSPTHSACTNSKGGHATSNGDCTTSKGGSRNHRRRETRISRTPHALLCLLPFHRLTHLPTQVHRAMGSIQGPSRQPMGAPRALSP